VRRRVLPRPAGSVVYELTSYGAELEDVVLRLAGWGAKSLGERRPDEIVTADSMIVALRTTFRPEAAAGPPVAFELRFGDVVIHARITDGKLETGAGGLDAPDLVIVARGPLRPKLAGDLSPAAIASGPVEVIGDPALLAQFVELFRIEPKPPPSPE
jgi:hypothetical protein